jgi:manganese efflux pump family protein
MSTDAFAVSLGKGASLRRPRLRDALRTGAVFGLVEGATPILGWLAGSVASRHVAAVDHWIAFSLLSLIGGKMVYEGLSRNESDDKPARRHGLAALALTAVGTSIDSFAVGVTLSLLNVSIYLTAAAIGFATFVMVTIGMLCGQMLGAKMGKRAEACGGALLILLGAKILFEHLAAG